MRYITAVLVLIFTFLSSIVFAQKKIGDTLFSQAQVMQKNGVKKRSKAILNKAIVKYTDAKKAYSSKEEKEKCDNQIAICRENIKIISDLNNHNTEIITEIVDSVAVEAPTQITDAYINLSQTSIDFKATEVNELKKIVIDCNYTDWTVEKTEEWVEYSVNNKEITIWCNSKNSGKQARIGRFTITCHNAKSEFTVTQQPKKLLNIKLPL